MWWPFRSTSASRTSRSRDVTTHFSQSSSQSSKSRCCGEISKTEFKTLYGHISAIRIGLADHLGIHSDQVRGSLLRGSFNIPHTRSIATSSQGQMEERHAKRYSTSLKNHRLFISENVFLLTFRLSPRNCRFGHHLRSHSGYGWGQGRCYRRADLIPKTRTTTRLVREDQVNPEAFKKFKVATHDSSVHYKKDSYDQMLFKDLVQKFLLQQKNNVKYEPAESDSHIVHSSGLTPDSMASSAKGATSASATRPSESSSSTGVQVQPPPGLPQPQPVRRRVTGKQAPSEFEINVINSLTEGILEINKTPINSDRSEGDQALQLLQDLRLHSRVVSRRYSRLFREGVQEAIKRVLISLSSSGHEVYPLARTNTYILPQKYIPVFAPMRIQAPHIFALKWITQKYFLVLARGVWIQPQ